MTIIIDNWRRLRVELASWRQILICFKVRSKDGSKDSDLVALMYRSYVDTFRCKAPGHFWASHAHSKQLLGGHHAHAHNVRSACIP